MSFLLANREGSIAYLQEEHAKTLRALHEEIRILQQKCSRLSFELTMSGSQSSRKEEYNALYLEELAEVRSELVSLRSQLSVQDEGMVLMQQRIKQLSKDLSSAKRSKRDIIRICNYELDQKAKTIAQLTAQLHRACGKMDYRMEQVLPLSTSSHHPLSPLLPTEHQGSRVYRKDGRPFSAHSGQIAKWSVVDGSLVPYPLKSPPTPITPPPPLPSSTPSIRRASRTQRHRLVRSLEHPSSTSPTSSRSTATDLSSTNWQPSILGPSRETTPELPQALATVKPVLPPIGCEAADGNPGDQNVKMPTRLSDLHMESALAPTTPLAPVVGVAGRHRRFVLAKSQGLSSAPCVSLRLLNYPHPKQVGSIGQEIHHQKSEQVEQTEGTLLVKQKVSHRDGSSSSVLQH